MVILIGTYNRFEQSYSLEFNSLYLKHTAGESYKSYNSTNTRRVTAEKFKHFVLMQLIVK
jgi:hypothetical protein